MSFSYFLKAPELRLSLDEFPYASFSTLEIVAEHFYIEFPANKMLGKQAETIFESWLKQAKHYQLVAANIQIQGATQTAGELDYLVIHSETNNTLHIELACKFYVLDATLGKTIPEQWIGPNRKDRLVDKLAKLKTKQFPLLHRKETASALGPFQLDLSVVQQQYCLKAFLFVPKYFRQDTLPRHFQDCLVGYYIHWEKLAIELDETALFALPSKKEWLLPPESLTTWISFSEAKKAITSSITEKRSPLVYKKTSDSIEQFFVVWW